MNIARQYKALFILFFVVQGWIGLAFGQSFSYKSTSKEINDCPYIFYNNDEVIVKWIEKGKLLQKIYKADVFEGLQFDCQDFKSEYLEIGETYTIEDRQQFDNVSKIVALSDIHGQHDLFISLLKTHSIIDEDSNWSFGDGHFVLNGDVFDRGDKVTETLWFLYKLEKQAKKVGGRVHYILGNHEVMVINGDLRYVSEKYRKVASLFNTSYDQLFNKHTLFGQWLRTKPVAISINKIAFTHGGFSPAFIKNKFNIEKTNRLFRESILDQPIDQVNESVPLRLLVKSNGPIWYRGYFKDETFTEETAQEILDAININAIVVGHTSHDQVLRHFSGKIFSVDSSIKKGEYGELLFWENNRFYRGKLSGEVEELK